MSGFQDSFLLCKNAAMSFATKGFLTTNESFQMRYYMKFYAKGLENCQKSKSKLPNLLNKGALFLELMTLTCGSFDTPWRKTSFSTSFESSH